jgi:(R,R)-butanediol dehydrogenase/meso-butanediol dehydrogenase/diacetyl reductase
MFRDGRLEVSEVAEPRSPGPGQVMIEVLACGICETDVDVYRHTAEFIAGAIDGGVGIYDFDAHGGIVMGHEFAGRVIEVGPDVSSVSIGDQVSGYASVVDDDGAPRVAGYSNRYPGGFGERMLVQADALERNPPGLSPEIATLAEPLSVGEKAVQRAGIEPDDMAVVLGAGPIGLGAIMALRDRRIAPIVALESSPTRQGLATMIGADCVLRLDDPGIAATLESRSEQAARVIAFECSGERGMINKLIHWLPRGAKLMVPGAYLLDDVIRPWVAIYKSIVINFQQGDTENAYPITLKRVTSGTFDASALITGRVGLDGVQEAFRELEGVNEHVRIVVTPQGQAINGGGITHV